MVDKSIHVDHRKLLSICLSYRQEKPSLMFSIKSLTWSYHHFLPP